MSKSKSKAVVVLSGGQDSTLCLFVALADGHDVHTVTFDYGQRHKREIESAKRIARRTGVTHEVVNVQRVLQGTSPLVSGAPLEQYKDHRSLPGGLEKTFVPMRNQLFLTIAANRAYVRGANLLYTGVCQEDFGGYPDCREVFIRSFEETSTFGTFTGDADTLPPLRIITPLMFLTKAQSVHVALSIPGCYEALAFTHTSYDGKYPPTGHDHATLLRAKGFEEAGIPDPLVLRAYLEGLISELPSDVSYRNPIVEPFIERVRMCMDIFHHDAVEDSNIEARG